jgi:pimeloyl-ACP methyl ester carboxylesterase
MLSVPLLSYILAYGTLAIFILLCRNALCLSLLTSRVPRDLKDRCLLQRCTSPGPPTTATAPPLVICIGLAQTMDPYRPHLLSLARNRDVLLYQADGLGLRFSGNTNVTLPCQAFQLAYAIQASFMASDSTAKINDIDPYIDGESRLIPSVDPMVIDIVGFSLGGRIALALACISLENILACCIHVRKLHLTGVALRRSDHGYLQSIIWKDHLLNGNLRAFAWSILLAAYSPSFLRQNENQLLKWVQLICESHTITGISSLVHQTYSDENDANHWSVEAMTKRLSQIALPPDWIIPQIRLMVGEMDVLAPPVHVYALVDHWNDGIAARRDPTWKIEVNVVPSAGHAVPIEAPRIWREDVIQFLELCNG